MPTHTNEIYHICHVISFTRPSSPLFFSLLFSGRERLAWERGYLRYEFIPGTCGGQPSWEMFSVDLHSR